ncbi:MAG: hypothetical protein ACLQVD_09455 [Capsulimonadaceae bacterium]
MSLFDNTAGPQSFAKIAPNGTPADNRRRLFMMLATAALAYMAFCLIIPLIPFSPHHKPRLLVASVVIGTTLLFMYLQMLLPWRMLSLDQPFTTEAREAAFLAVLWLLMSSGRIAPSHGYVAQAAYGCAVNIIYTLTGCLVGAMVARIVREAKILLPLALVAGVIDIVGAMTPVGFTHNALKNHPGIVSKVSVHVPTMHGLHLVSMIGPGDTLFIGFFFAIVLRQHLNATRTFAMMYAFLTITMLAVELGFLREAGALAPMGLAVILANLSHFKFSREETFAMIYAGAIAVAMAMAFFLYTSGHLFHHPQGPTQ